MRRDDLLARLGHPRKSGNGYSARCKGHRDRQPSLSITFRDGRAWLYCHSGCLFDHILAAHGLTARDLYVNDGNEPLIVSREERVKAARRLWEQSRCARNSVVEQYLRNRGISIPLPGSLRFIPMLKHREYGWPFPAMAVGLQDRDSNFCGVQITWLCADGSGKAPVEPARKTFGALGGGAVRLTPAGETLVLTEGIETRLSILQAIGISAWVALGTSNLARVELPEMVREVIICADNDPNGSGERAAIKAAWRFQREGRQTRIVTPDIGDFNDMLAMMR